MSYAATAAIFVISVCLVWEIVHGEWLWATLSLAILISWYFGWIT